MAGIVERLVPDELWELFQRVVPEAPSRPQGGGRRRHGDREVLAAIVFVATSGCTWQQLPAASFGPSGATAHRRFAEWTKARVWAKLHRLVLDELGSRGDLDWSRCAIDSVKRLSPETFDELCPSSMLPIRMQNKWAPLIMRLLGEGAQPFSELRKALPRTSPKELTRALRSLDRDGFITRDADAESPGYSLTPLGQSLLLVLLDVYAWTAEHWDELVDARERADHPEAGSPVNNVLARNS